jgi:hypothetical protein
VATTAFLSRAPTTTDFAIEADACHFVTIRQYDYVLGPDSDAGAAILKKSKEEIERGN